MTKKQPPLARRDATGHMNPKYEQELLDESKENRSNQASDSASIYRKTAGDQLG